MMEIRIGPEKIIEVLEGIKKKTKMDRYEEMVMSELISLLEDSIEVEAPIQLPQPEDFKKPIETPHEGMVVADKIAIVGEVMRKFNPKGLELREWMKESIGLGQKLRNIKTVPKSNSIESYYDWLVENDIIEANGNPKGK